MSYSQYVSYHTTEMYYFLQHITSLTDERNDITTCGFFVKHNYINTLKIIFTVPVTRVKNPVTGSL